MNSIIEQENTINPSAPDSPVFSKELAELLNEAQQSKAPLPQPPPRKRALPVTFQEPYGWD